MPTLKIKSLVQFLTILLGVIGLNTSTYAAQEYASPSVVKAPKAAQAEGAIDKGDARVVATLMTAQDAVARGGAARVGVLMQMDNKWHVYWHNSGDAGLPTQIKWRMRVDDGAWTDAGQQMRWPAPYTFLESGGQITTYGYASEVLHDRTLKIPSTAKSRVTIEASVNFLTCAKICIPGNLTLTRDIAVGAPIASADQARFKNWATHIPVEATARGWKVEVQRDPVYPGATPLMAFSLTCQDSARCGGVVLDQSHVKVQTDAVIPLGDETTVWSPARLTSTIVETKQQWIVEFKGKSKQDIKPGKSTVGGVLRLKDSDGAPRHIRFSTEVEVLAVAPTAPITPDTAAPQPIAQTTPAPANKPISLVYALLLALVGGLLLNGMPCVFPVLTLKLSALAQMATASKRSMVAQALAYTAGILVSMAVLATVIVVLRVAGTQVGWGFQFQNPWYLTAQCALLVLFAVNLFGGFEVLLPVNININAMELEDDGLARSFFEGLLCVLLATPCTAPLMGTAVGFALTSSTVTIFAIFLTLGLGLASPFLLLVALPGWRKWMPKPGGWLNRLKQLMGFSLLGTSVWLTWVVGSSYGIDGMFKLLMFLVLLAFASWAYGAVQFVSGKRKWATLVLLVALIAGSGWTLLDFRNTAIVGVTSANTTDKIWTPFDEVVIKETLAKGQPVFVDFTADWCISCKVNERTVLSSETVQAAIKKHNVLMMKADWTRRDERIRTILMKYGKAGVPMYLVYRPSAPNAPEVLPEVLTPGIVVKALAGSTKTP